MVATVDGVDPLRRPSAYGITVEGPAPPEVTTVTVTGDLMLGRRVGYRMAARATWPRRCARWPAASPPRTSPWATSRTRLSTAGPPQQGGDSFGADPGVRAWGCGWRASTCWVSPTTTPETSGGAPWCRRYDGCGPAASARSVPVDGSPTRPDRWWSISAPKVGLSPGRAEGGRDAAGVSFEEPLERLADVEQVEPIGHLAGLRGGLGGCVGEGGGAVPAEHLDLRVLAQPGLQRDAVAAGEQFGDRGPLQVNDDGTVARPFRMAQSSTPTSRRGGSAATGACLTRRKRASPLAGMPSLAVSRAAGLPPRASPMARCTSVERTVAWAWRARKAGSGSQKTRRGQPSLAQKKRRTVRRSSAGRPWMGRSWACRV